MLTSPDRICSLRETHLLCDDSDDGSWLQRPSSSESEADVSDEAYASGFHLSLQNSNMPGVVRLTSQDAVTRLPRVDDVMHESVSTDSDQEALYITSRV